LKITRAQNPKGAANQRHRQHRQQLKREKKELVRQEALWYSTSQHPVPTPVEQPTIQGGHRDSSQLQAGPSSWQEPDRLVSSSFAPLVNIVPTPDEEVGLIGVLKPHRLVHSQDEDQTHPEPPQLNEAESDGRQEISAIQEEIETEQLSTLPTTLVSNDEYVLEVTLNDTDSILPPLSPVHHRLASIVIVPETSSLAKRKTSSSSNSSRRHPPKRPRREPPGGKY